MLSGISITCFAASYFVALLLETSRLVFRSGLRGALMIGFASAGLVAHTLFLVYRAMTAQGVPLSSSFDWLLVAAWMLAAFYLYFTIYHSKSAVGLFILPLVLALIGVAHFRADPTPFARGVATQVWGMIHGVLLLLGTVAVLVGFVSGLMYLVHAHQLKHKLRPRRGLQLPSLEWLERVNALAIVISVLMLGTGFLSGMVLNLVHHRHQQNEVPWNDPVVWSSGILLGWVVLAAVFSALYKPARQGRKVAYLTIASFLLLVFTFTMRFMLSSAHDSAGVQGSAAFLARHVEARA